MTRSPPTALERALDISQRMLTASERAEWSIVQALDEQLRRVLETAGPATEATRSVFETLAGNQHRIGQRACTARDALNHELGRHRYSRRALHAYLAQPR